MTNLVLSLVLLLALFLGSAMAVIYRTYDARRLFTEIQGLKQQLDRSNLEWGRMQLELLTLADHNRIENKARNELGLIDPEQQKIIYIKVE